MSATIYSFDSLRKSVDSPALRWTSATLTAREHQVATLAGMGLEDKEIAVEMGVSHHTVRAFKRDISKKIGLRGKGAVEAFGRRLLEPVELRKVA